MTTVTSEIELGRVDYLVGGEYLDQEVVVLPPAPAAAPSSGLVAVAGPPGDVPDHGLERKAYALLECPDSVLKGQEFALEVGLSPTPMPGVTGDSMSVPYPGDDGYLLTVQIVADGFEVGPSERWTHDLRVTTADPFPTIILRLRALMPVDEAKAFRITAQYSIEGQLVGFAERLVAVLASKSDTAVVPPRGEPKTVAYPQGVEAPDLTISIQKQGEIVGELRWTFMSKGKNAARTEAALSSNIGAEPQRFARALVDQMTDIEGKPGVALRLAGLGARIAENIPDEIWAAIATAGQGAAPEPPSILIVSEEPYVPWELARMESPFDPGAAPYLAAQANMGRWVLSNRARPTYPPPSQKPVADFAVVYGEYDPQFAENLTWAVAEAAVLQDQYAATATTADHESVIARLTNLPGPDAVHFAVHGKYAPDSTDDGLYLTDRRSLLPTDIEGMRLDSGRPFVFLNACQVGSGDEVLGDYSGMGSAFLYAGASAVVAPLWSVSDEKAKEVAMDFYRAVFAGENPSAALRRIRAGWTDEYATISSTEMAYQYFGHPLLQISRLPKS